MYIRLIFCCSFEFVLVNSIFENYKRLPVCVQQTCIKLLRNYNQVLITSSCSRWIETTRKSWWFWYTFSVWFSQPAAKLIDMPSWPITIIFSCERAMRHWPAKLYNKIKRPTPVRMIWNDDYDLKFHSNLINYLLWSVFIAVEATIKNI